MQGFPEQDNTPVWFITGCSTGLGRALAELIVQRGWRVVVTARDKHAIADIERSAPERVLALSLDVTRPADIDAAVAATRDQFGRIDVLVNNAGYGYQSTVEEGEEAEIRAQFDTNVFGLFAMTRAVLPLMREQRKGNILNITSVAGLIGYPGSGYYAASKHAVEGWSDALRAEVLPLGIGVTCVEPGPFRTDWAGRSLRQTTSGIADYADTAASAWPERKKPAARRPVTRSRPRRRWSPLRMALTHHDTSCWAPGASMRLLSAWSNAFATSRCNAI